MSFIVRVDVDARASCRSPPRGMTLPTGSLSHSTASSSYSETVAALHERPTSRLVVKSSGPEDERASNSSEDDDEVDGELSRAEQLRNWVRRLRRTFGTSFLLLVSTVYAVQGFTSFRSLAVNYFFKDNLQLQPADAQSLLTVMMVPWSTKPLYGIISDSFPLFGYHRKSAQPGHDANGCSADAHAK
ncbi:hypothetical protein ON010_g8615 [Phytophthora cinnamomi]|nr:hypothetical protein ON010_g8615 [Phytophthora cinnamomi]